MKYYIFLGFVLIVLALCWEKKKEITCKSEQDCEIQFLYYLQEQTIILKFEHSLINQEQLMPGFALYVDKNQQKGSIDYIFKTNYFHTEKEYLFNDLLEKIKKDTPSQLSLLFPGKDGVKYASITGDYFIYIYASPCVDCLQLYFKLAQKFPFINFHIYYTVEYKANNFFKLKPFEDKDDFFFSKHCKHQKSKLKPGAQDCTAQAYKDIIQGKQSMAENIKFMKVSSIGQKYNNVYKDLYKVFTKNYFRN